MTHVRHFLLVFCLIILLAACQPAGSNTATTLNSSVPGLAVLEPTLADPGIVAPRATPDLAQLPLLAAHLQQVQKALGQSSPVLLLDEGLDSDQHLAQTIATQNPNIHNFTNDAQTNAPFRTEVFGVYPIRASDMTQQTASCATHKCYRVEMYNYATNAYLASVVDLQTQKVLSAVGYVDVQPDIPPVMTQIALEMATHSPEVQKALGYTPKTTDAVMANTKSALNNTLCERSKHLCVAPTFVVDTLALWAIVDLTDGRLVGVRWTEVGSTTPITEKSLENDAVMRRYCGQNTELKQDGWQMNYMLTSSDGLRISDVNFQGNPVLESAKLVDWHVSYSSSEGFGYSDAVGCPVFSQAAVIAFEPPKVEEIKANGEVVGFALVQKFSSQLWPLPCNYNYEQRYEFYRDGRFRPVVMSIGRGCGDDGTYRPVTRIAMADPHSTFSQWNGSAWQDWTSEAWRLAADVKPNTNGNSFRVSNSSGGYYMEPSTGQFNDGGRGDNAYIYVTEHHADRDEGDSDMPTIGPCCNTDYHQGPDKFIDPTPEAITDSSLVIWYVAQLHNDDTKGSEYCWAETVLENGLYVPREYPCPSGPLFVPINALAAEKTDTP